MNPPPQPSPIDDPLDAFVETLTEGPRVASLAEVLQNAGTVCELSTVDYAQCLSSMGVDDLRGHALFVAQNRGSFLRLWHDGNRCFARQLTAPEASYVAELLGLPWP